MTSNAPVWKLRTRLSVNVDVPNIFSNSATKDVSLTLGAVNLVSVSVKIRRPGDNVWRLRAKFGTVPHARVFVKLQTRVILVSSIIPLHVCVNQLLQSAVKKPVQWSGGTEIVLKIQTLSIITFINIGLS